MLNGTYSLHSQLMVAEMQHRAQSIGAPKEHLSDLKSSLSSLLPWTPQPKSGLTSTIYDT